MVKTIKLSVRKDYDSQDDLGGATIFYNKADMRKRPENFADNMQDTFGLLELIDTGNVAICSKIDDKFVSEIKKEIADDAFSQYLRYYLPDKTCFFQIKTQCITPDFSEEKTELKNSGIYTNELGQSFTDDDLQGTMEYVRKLLHNGATRKEALTKASKKYSVPYSVISSLIKIDF